MRKVWLFFLCITNCTLCLQASVEEPENYNNKQKSDSVLVSQFSTSDFQFNIGKFEIFNPSNDSPQLKFNWGYTVKPALNLSAERLNTAGNNDNLYIYSYDKEFADISMFNLSLNYKIVKDAILSINYFHFTQNQPFNAFYCENYFSNKFSLCKEADLEEILDLKLIFRQSQSLEARLLALWSEVGKTYSNNTDDTKTFEIRGEVVVNF